MIVVSSMQKQLHFLQFEKKVEDRFDRIENQLSVLIDQGSVQKEDILEIKDQLKDNQSMLRQLSVSFRKRIKRQQCLLTITTLGVVLLLFWIVAKV